MGLDSFTYVLTSCSGDLCRIQKKKTAQTNICIILVFVLCLTDPVQPGLFYKQLRHSLIKVTDGLWKYIQSTVNPKPEELES